MTATIDKPATMPERTRKLVAAARARATQPGRDSPKQRNWTHAFFERYAKEPLRRRQALSFAWALTNEPVILHADEEIVGLVRQAVAGSGSCDLGGAEFDARWRPYDAGVAIADRVAQEVPEILLLNGGLPDGRYDPEAWLTGIPWAPGHIGWRYDWILQDGVEGMFHRIDAAWPEADAEGREFLDGARIVWQAVLDWNERHVAALEERVPKAEGGERARLERQLEICRRVPRQGARTFREAAQAFHITYLATIYENPHGGNGPGRLDYFLWPYLERDLAASRETLASARELVDELFIRFHERLGFEADGWVETIVAGGCDPEGRPSISPLSQIMVESIGALRISHPSVYIRMPEGAPEEWREVAAQDLRTGGNRAQVVSDTAVVRAMTRGGELSVQDARMYMCGGCMEISPHGMNSDLLFAGFFNTPKVLELTLNGGCCLRTGRRLLPAWPRTLEDFATFDEFFAAFAGELRTILRLTFRCMEIAGEEYARLRPRFLVSSQVEDCLARGRGLHAGGARYEDFGSTPLGIPNLADSLYAIEQAVFVERFVTAGEMLAALRSDFAGREALRARLLALPKFGQRHAGADAMANRAVGVVCDAYDGYRNRHGRRVKPMIMTFMMAPVAGRALGATPDGRRAGEPIAQGLTPQSGAMTQGLTSAMLSANSLDLARFSGGAASMWDLASEFATQDNVRALLQAFLATGGQMFQGNMTDIAELERARREPERHRDLMVRIGGYSGRFVACAPELQDEIIRRRRHGGAKDHRPPVYSLRPNACFAADSTSTTATVSPVTTRLASNASPRKEAGGRSP